MEFKVIFAGFALHCVLNTVLICKSVITKGQDEQNAVAIEQQEKSMLKQLASGDEKLQRLTAENPKEESPLIRISR